MGGVILAIIEGVAALLVKSTSKSPREQQLEQLEFEKQQLEFQKQQHDMAQNGGPPQVYTCIFHSFGCFVIFS